MKKKIYSFNETNLISSLNVTMSYMVFGDSSDINLTNRRTIEFSTFIIFKAVINVAAPRSTWSSFILFIVEVSFNIGANLKKRDLRTGCKSSGFNVSKSVWDYACVFLRLGTVMQELIILKCGHQFFYF